MDKIQDKYYSTGSTDKHNYNRNRKYKLEHYNSYHTIEKGKWPKIIKNGVCLVVGSITILVFSNKLIGNYSEQNVTYNIENISNINGTNTIYSVEETSNTTVEESSELTTVDSFSLENRIKNIPQNSQFMIGTKVDTNKLTEFSDTEMGKIFIKYAQQFGIDPYLLIAQAIQETQLNHWDFICGGNKYNGYSVGVCQLENPSGNPITAYDYNCNEYITEYITMDNAQNLDTNIKIATMQMQNKLYDYNGNSEEIGQSVENIMQDYQNFGWLKYIYDMHENPSKYLSNWSFNTYGDGEYIKHVLQYFPGTNTYYNYDNKLYEINLNNGEIVKVDIIDNKVK